MHPSNFPPRLLPALLLLAGVLSACDGRWPAAPATVVHAPASAPVAAAGTPTASAPEIPTPAAAPASTPGDAQATLEAEEPSTAPAPGHPNISFGRLAGLHRAPNPLGLTASSVALVDTQNGELIYGRNEKALLPIASLTKLMTALVVLQSGVRLDEVIRISEDDVDRVRNSRSRLRPGTELTRAEALHLALMSSENRAAHALGRHHPGGLDAFVAAMNAQAGKLGLGQTSFADPTGLSNRNQSTASDVAKLVAAASRQPLLREYSTTPRYQAEFGKRRLQYLNSNRLVRNGKGWDIQMQKTGYISEAGQCLAMRTRVGERDVVMVLLDAGSKSDRSGDAERLRRWLANRTDMRVAQAGAEAPAATPPRRAGP